MSCVLQIETTATIRWESENFCRGVKLYDIIDDAIYIPDLSALFIKYLIPQ